MAEIDNPYGVDGEMERAHDLFQMLAEGFSGQQLSERFDLPLDRIEALVARYVERIVRGPAPGAPGPECLINGFNGWCVKHGCFHPSTGTAPNPGGE